MLSYENPTFNPTLGIAVNNNSKLYCQTKFVVDSRLAPKGFSFCLKCSIG